MKLSDYNNKTFMLTLHQKIEEYAAGISDILEKGAFIDHMTYPPNNGFTEKEIRSLEKLKHDPDMKSGLRKIIADNTAGVLFDLLNIIDGTSDPDEWIGKWTEISFVDKTDKIEENKEMLHDHFYSSYWDWRAVRPNKDWKLDTYEF